MTRHFHDSLRPSHPGEQCSRSSGDVLHACQVTWIMVSDAGRLRFGRGNFQSANADKFVGAKGAVVADDSPEAALSLGTAGTMLVLPFTAVTV